MPLNTDSLDLLLYLLAACFLATLVYVAVLKLAVRRERRNVKAITITLTEYFRKSGVEVSVGCVALPGTKLFTAFIESEPMKRFRLSHIIEMTLREQVRKTCGLELNKVYWRFPIKEAAREASAPGATTSAGKPGPGADDYINEGLVHYKDLPKFEVTEIPWEKFEEAATIESEKKEKL
jgi:hypothetical protein